MYEVESIINDVLDGRTQHRDLGSIKGVMIHRVGVDFKSGVVIGYDAPSICYAFLGRTPQWQSVAKVTGGQNPYTFYVGGDTGPGEYDGKIWQSLPFDEIGHHGRRYSATHMGVGLIGDFRVQPASRKQWRAAVDLVSDIVMLLGIPPSQVVGHGEVATAHGGDKAPGRAGACPGGLLPMDIFRRGVTAKIASWLRHQSFGRLTRAGVQLI